MEGDNVYVYKVDKENTVKKVPVEIGLRKKGIVEIKTGLEDGDTVVAEGLKKTRPKTKIKDQTTNGGRGCAVQHSTAHPQRKPKDQTTKRVHAPPHRIAVVVGTDAVQNHRKMKQKKMRLVLERGLSEIH